MDVCTWYDDNWHPIGSLVNHFGPRIIYDAGSREQARLNEYIVNNSWCMPAAVSRDILTMNCYMPDSSSNANVPDCAVWCFTGNGQDARIHASGHGVPSEFISL